MLEERAREVLGFESVGDDEGAESDDLEEMLDTEDTIEPEECAKCTSG